MKITVLAALVLPLVSLAGCLETTATELIPCNTALVEPGTVLGDTVTTATGLKYLEVQAGTGQTAAQNQQAVSVHYTGYFTDGTPFDSSCNLGSPLKFVVGNASLITGFEQGIVGMRVGGVRRLVVPPGLAYGETGRGNIPPNTTLVFDVELVDLLSN